jgi:hypothetical protein
VFGTHSTEIARFFQDKGYRMGEGEHKACVHPYSLGREKMAGHRLEGDNEDYGFLYL